MDAVDSSRR